MSIINENKISKGVALSQETWDICDRKMTELNLRSRNEFIRDAIQFYIEWLDHQNNKKFLTPEFESVIGAKIHDSEERLARILFKLAVDQNYLAHVLSASVDVDEDWLASLRKDCVREVSETNGRLKVEKIIENEHGEWQD